MAEISWFGYFCGLSSIPNSCSTELDMTLRLWLWLWLVKRIQMETEICISLPHLELNDRTPLWCLLVDLAAAAVD